MTEDNNKTMTPEEDVNTLLLDAEPAASGNTYAFEPKQETADEIKVPDELDVKTAARRQRIFKIIRYAGTYLFLTIMALIVIFPFYWMVISSLKTMEEYRANVPTLWPHKVYLTNFATAFSKANSLPYPR